MVPWISVVIPLYNGGQYIASAIDSILAQTIQDFEIIIVNDGSTDGGEKIVGRYSDSRIILFNQKNRGDGAARNQGIKCAKAEIIAFLDADDLWYPSFLETIEFLINKYPLAGAYATGIVEIENNKEIFQTFRTIPNEEYDGLIHLIEAAVIGERFVTSSSVAIKKSVLCELSGFREGVTWGADNDLWARIALKYPIAFSNKNCSRYIVRDPQQKRVYRVTATKEHPFIKTGTEFLASHNEGAEQYESVKKYVDRLRIDSVRYNLMVGDSTTARDLLVECAHQDYAIQKIFLYMWTYIPASLYKHFGQYVFRFLISCVVVGKKSSRAVKKISRVFLNF